MTLVIMAAGMGSRYGGLKQIDSVGPNGEIIMDYSIYDAKRAGFNKVVFIIKKEIETIFKEKIGSRIEKIIETHYVYQQLDKMLPSGVKLPENRVKPLGTGHAILCCKGIVNEPFAVINADDYYGPQAFKLLYEFLSKQNSNDDKSHYAMVGFKIGNTLTENGTVARGVCEVDENGILQTINERTKIANHNGKIAYTENETDWIEIPENATVSMNCWGFSLDILDELEKQFADFFNVNKDNLEKAEFFLPFVVDKQIQNGQADVKVLKTDDKWYGVTYQEDKQNVSQSLQSLMENGTYPSKLWEK